MITEIKTAIEATKAVADIVKTGLAAANQQSINEALYEVREKLYKLQELALEDQQKRVELEAENRALKDRSEEIKRYRVIKLPTESIIRELMVELANGEPIRYICDNCANKGHLSTLQPEIEDPSVYKCVNCKAEIWVRH